ncbi:hypothetical protein AB0I66_32115 [Streptomyces sp. NPDC050439]
MDVHKADLVVWTATEDVAHLLRAAGDVEDLARSLSVWVVP